MLRHRVRVPAGGTVRIALWTSLAATRAGVLDLLDRHQEANAFVRAGTLTWTQGQVQLRHLGIDAAEANLFQRLAGHVLYANAAMRPVSATINRGAAAPQGLWAQGISGDLPIVLVRIDNVEDIDIVRQLLRAQEYWRLKQLAVDLVILNERATTYVQDLQEALETQLRMSQSRPRFGGDNARGRSLRFTQRSDFASDARAAARRGPRGVVRPARQPGRAARPPSRTAGMPGSHSAKSAAATRCRRPWRCRRIWSFSTVSGASPRTGANTSRSSGPGRPRRLPGSTSIANPQFGFQVAAEGGGYTWSLNSRENQLTPWSNDPVTDRSGEVLYLRDEESGELWSPTASPIRDASATYVARHGQGYSRFEHASHGIALELTMYVPLADPIKISRLRIRNASQQTRRLSVTAYAECVLGASRGATAPSIVTES